MPWVVRDAVRDVNRAVGRRWQAIDPLLPDPAALPAGCGAPLVVPGDHGRIVGLGICVHQHVPPQSLNQTWGAAERFTLVPRLAGPDVSRAAGELLALWRDHLVGAGAARGADTSASVVWPSLDITGVQSLLGHGLQPLTVVAARARPASPPRQPRPVSGVAIRRAGPADEEQVTDLELRLIRYDAHFGGPVIRPATARLVREEIRTSLSRQESWTWLAERGGRPVGLLVAQPPGEASWIAGMTGMSPAAYLQTMFVDQRERGTGIGAALVRMLHARLDRAGVAVTLLHHSQVNPLSAPFWYRMGYRPLWTSWEARPATALRLTPGAAPVPRCWPRRNGASCLLAERRLGRMLLSLAAAVFAALCYGVASVMQAIAVRVASGRSVPGRGGVVSAGMLARLVGQWRFAASVALDLLGFAAQLVALRRLPLFAVQAIVAANLAVVAVLATVVIGATLSAREWLAVTGVVAGVGLLGSSAGGEGAQHAGAAFKIALIMATAVLGLCGLAAGRLRDPARTVALGVVGGLGYGVLGIAARVLNGLGPLTLVRDPAAYAVVAAGIVSFVFYASALADGSVTVATAAVVLAETLPPAVVGVLFLSDSTRPGMAPAATTGFALAVASALALARFGEPEHHHAHEAEHPVTAS